MIKPKDLRVSYITAKSAKDAITKWHYSGKVDPRSKINFGIFYKNSLCGAMQFGPSINKHKTIRLVANTRWNGFLELNRMALSPLLPKNSESRCLGAALRYLKKDYPHVEWVISFSDATQSGDGHIYRATGFVLTQISKNKSMWLMPDNTVVCNLAFTISTSTALRLKWGWRSDDTWSSFIKRIGATPLLGFQLRYIKFLNPSARERLTVSEIPFEEIKKLGASMYLGKRAASIDNDALPDQGREGGVNPTAALQTKTV